MEMVTGALITLLTASLVYLALARADHARDRLEDEDMPGDDAVVLVVIVREVDGKLLMSANGPGGSYRLCHSMFAAATLAAEVVRQADAGVEGGLQLMEEQTLHVLNNGRRA